MNFPQGTFFLFQHFPGIDFKELGVPGTRDAPQTATKLTIWLTLSLFIGAFSAAPQRQRAKAFVTVLGAKRALRR
jgi:hypothetical protein